MNADDNYLLTARQLERLHAAFQRGAAESSSALQTWLERPSLIIVEATEQLALQEATNILGADEAPICFCSAEMTGRLAGELILAFDDASGLALADMLLGQPRGTAGQWDELAMSAALETTNIVGCAYLNALARQFPPATGGAAELIPAPPRFRRDFAESLLEFAFMEQAAVTNHFFLSRSQFQIDKEPIHWTLLFIPDVHSVRVLRSLLSEDSVAADGPQLRPG